MLNYSRGINITFTLMIRGFNDLKNKYGKENKYGIEEAILLKNIGEKNDDILYYCIKDSNGEIVSLCYTKSTPNTIEVKLINSKKNSNYKYVAQNMLAIIAQKVLSGNFV